LVSGLAIEKNATVSHFHS